ncbi:X-linked retinitis pigmentosa GTPase regulator [Drosophila innubila]|uniref:X-linked retinitis pigmentosa GTPase regulator n=1 Tax=Drosophila innubila TaxID=198719 RepID=UPI00148CBF9B|nr:X-linked retinitis pigmentosa GTPase regulator [Drosophila innubila]
MDIPSSGAIFTLGKSHLAENTQSYFYIKNDPVKRLISGPHQSAVICESGRLFVWGENHYGQLGIGGHGNKANSNNSNNNNGDIVSKPTCVKSLKTLGLKINDAAFGQNWAVIMTLSNEIFFTGRNIFPVDTHVAQHFIDAVVEEQPCAIIRKPFRLEEFDDYLSKNEETDNFIAVQAGNEHFVVLTTKGRLIGCGSNAEQQLGDLEVDYDGHPVEILLDAAVQQFACGPMSTLVLTASGNLFLTGRLNEFVFPKFTELQKNLSQTERIIFMHISKASEIFIVTNVGSIYRSFESLRNKSLVFQRFYDYDSEENGPIWKLLKGFSFYAVLSKANKFFTTFSESGHHLKTFREISKFKNLRLLDIAVGEQHILVQGLPRSSTLSATAGATAEPHSYMSRSFVLQPKDPNGNPEMRSASGRSLTKQNALKEPETDTEQGFNAMGASVAAVGAGVATLEAVKHMSNEQGDQQEEDEQPEETKPKEEENKAEEAEQASKGEVINGNVEQPESNQAEKDQELQEALHAEAEKSEAIPQVEKDEKQKELASDQMEPSAPMESPAREVTSAAAVESIAKLPTPPASTPSPQKSSTESLNSSKFAYQEKSQSSNSQEKQLRPRTPYPDSSNASTPQTIKRTPIRNFSYEAAMNHDEIERTSPDLVDSLDTVEENSLAEGLPHTDIQISTPTPPTEEDEQLAVEITTTEDAEDSTKVVNEIRFINNGIDVTAKVEEQMPDTPLGDSVEELESESEQMLQDLEQHVDKVVVEQKEEAVKATEGVGTAIESKLLETRDSMQSAMRKATTGARDAVGATGERMANGAQRMAYGARDAVDAVGKSAQRMASDAKHSMEQAGSNAAKAASNTKESMGKAMDSMTNKISSEVDGVKENISSLFQIKAAKEVQLTTTPSSTPEEARTKGNSDTAGSVEGEGEREGEEDERTTASVNSNHNSASNGNGNRLEADTINAYEEDPLDAVVERGKKAMQEELRALEEQRAQSHVHNQAEKPRRQSTESKGIVQQFLDGMRLSCRNEKAVQIEDEPPPPSQTSQPPHYSKNKVNSELSLQNGQNGAQQSSRVCTIL